MVNKSGNNLTSLNSSSSTLEKCSSAFTLSDMEIFIFPDLLYALVLANIISPEIWKWLEDPWFAGIAKMGPLKKIHRVKQYIMDHYHFNLDLETWGLTDKQTEIDRFKEFTEMDMLSRSNALFGYEGDKYYFDLDIRKHFGLDKFDSDIIPYWKTETVEAMNAFRYKPDHEAGAGECVSLACLYAAALFIVAKIPLGKIFLMGTPLHSQNFVIVDEGVLTNNRRIVTRSMWFNGSELSTLARRALEHEQVTYVSHCSGYIHVNYHEATIDPGAYHHFQDKITAFLQTRIDFEIFINFLRACNHHQKLFQLLIHFQGTQRFIPIEKAFGYEHGSKNRLSDKNGWKLLDEMDDEDLSFQPSKERFLIDRGNQLFNTDSYSSFLHELKQCWPGLINQTDFLVDLEKFVHTIPQLPSSDKEFTWSKTDSGHLCILPGQSRMEILEYLQSRRQPEAASKEALTVVDLAFYAGRFMDFCEWKPFLKAAFERNPVSVTYFLGKELGSIYSELISWTCESIYDGNRLALPDEVVNFKRGDGIEMAISLANVAKSRHIPLTFEQNGSKVSVLAGDEKFAFSTTKNLILPDHTTFE
jgi:hypothetical protein